MHGQGNHEGVGIWCSVFTMNYSPCTEYFARVYKVCLLKKKQKKPHCFTVIRSPRLFFLKISWLKQVSKCQFMTRIDTKIGKGCEIRECQGEEGPTPWAVSSCRRRTPHLHCLIAAAAALLTHVGGAVTSGLLASSGLGTSPKLLHQPVGFQLYPSSKASPLK